MKPQLPHWAIALLLAAGLHVGLAVAWVGLQKAPEPLRIDAGGLDVVVAIAPAFAPPAAVEQPAAVVVPVETVVAAVEPAVEEPFEAAIEAAIEPVIEPVVEPAVEPIAEPLAALEPESDSVEELPEELPVEQPPIAVAEPIPDMPLLVAVPTVEPTPTPVVKTRPATKPKTQPKYQPIPKPKPKPATPIKPVVQPVSRVRKVVSEAVKQPPQNQSAQVQQKFTAQMALAGSPVDSNQAAATASAAQPSQSDEQRAAEQGYYGRLARRIAKHKRYPRAAKRERSTGTVVVTFTVAVDGRLQQSRVTKSSGDPRLDEAALTMLKRASPFPPLLVAMGRRSKTITLPVEFALRR